jgi:hypothetical protein
MLRDSLAFRDPEVAAAHLRRAVELNPFYWRYRVELAVVDELSGDPDVAEVSLLEALRLNPRDGAAFWHLANFYLRQRETERAAEILGDAVGADPRLAEVAFRQLRKADVSFRSIDQVWPQDQRARLSLLRLSLAEAAPNTDSPPITFLDQQWTRLTAAPENLTVSQGTPVIDHLLRRGQSQLAKRRWVELNLLNAIKDHAFQSGKNRVWNGGFELPQSKSGLGWRLGTTNDYSAVLVPATESGTDRALRVDFFGRVNLDFSGVQQIVVVRPGEHLRLECRMRSQTLTTLEGPFLQVLDETYRQLAATAPILGDTPWTTQAVAFRVPKETRILYLRVRRRASGRIDSRISGTLWIDEVQLAPISEPAL